MIIKTEVIDELQEARSGRSTIRRLIFARGLALFLGCFSLLNLLGELLVRHFDANLWWIDFHPLPAWFAHLFLFFAALGLLVWGSGCRCNRWQRRGILLLTAGLLGVVLFNMLNFYYLIAARVISTDIPVPVPLSLLLLLGLLLIVKSMVTGDMPAATWRMRFGVVLSLLLCLVVFPLAQVFLFGKTDYRRPADAIVVLGAQAYADGTPSDALADRVHTACRLYRQGYAPLLIFSGGPGSGAVHETESMRRMAMRQYQVPDAAILLDPDGVNTQATVRGTTRMFREHRIKRVIAVSHFFHLPRIKLTYQRAGWDVYTVPAEKPRLHDQVPYLVCREVAGLLVYYLRPLWGG